jgi:hypothetical protein
MSEPRLDAVFGGTRVGASKPDQANGTELTGAFSTALLVSAGAGLVVGPLLDRRSPRILMTAGAAAGALLVAGWSRANTVGVRGSYRPAGVAPRFHNPCWCPLSGRRCADRIIGWRLQRTALMISLGSVPLEASD